MQFDNFQRRSSNLSPDSSDIRMATTGSTPTPSDPFSFSPSPHSPSIGGAGRDSRQDNQMVADANSVSSTGVDDRQRKEKVATEAAPKSTKSETTKTKMKTQTPAPKANTVTAAGMNKATTAGLGKTIDLLNYPDTMQILASQDAGSMKYLWMIVILGLVGLSAYQVTQLVIDLVNEETGTKITYTNIDNDADPDFAQKFKMKICFKEWPDPSTFRKIYETSTTAATDETRTNQSLLGVQLAIQNQLNGASTSETVVQLQELDNQDYAKLVKETKTELNKGVIERFSKNMINDFYAVSGEELIMQGLGGVGRQLCVKVDTSHLNQIKSGHLVINQEFPTKNDEQPKLVGSKFTFYGGTDEEYLSGAHFIEIEKPIGYYMIELKRYKFSNRRKAPCEEAVDSVYPRGFAQTKCQQKCWTEAYETEYGCSKISLNSKSPEPSKEICTIPDRKTEEEYAEQWTRVKSHYRTCVIQNDCSKKQFCQEYEMLVKLIEPTPVATHCLDGKVGINTERCNYTYMFMLNGRVEELEEYARHDIVSVLSDSGGQIGLWIGFSVLELAKMIFHWIIKMKNTRKVRHQITKELAKDIEQRGSSARKDKATVDALMATRNQMITQNAFQQSRLGLGLDTGAASTSGALGFGSNLNYMGSQVHQLSNDQLLNMIRSQGIPFAPQPNQEPPKYFNAANPNQATVPPLTLTSSPTYSA